MKIQWLEHMLRQHHQEAYSWALQCCFHREEEAKDVLQTVYLKVLEGKARFGEKSSPKTWLFSVIKYTAIEYLKQLPLTMEVMDTWEEETEEELYYDSLIRKLPERQQQVLLLVFYHNQTLEEVAQILDISIGSVRTHYDRGKKRLKELILKQQAV